MTLGFLGRIVSLGNPLFLALALSTLLIIPGSSDCMSSDPDERVLPEFLHSAGGKCISRKLAGVVGGGGDFEIWAMIPEEEGGER